MLRTEQHGDAHEGLQDAARGGCQHGRGIQPEPPHPSLYRRSELTDDTARHGEGALERSVRRERARVQRHGILLRADAQPRARRCPRRTDCDGVGRLCLRGMDEPRLAETRMDEELQVPRAGSRRQNPLEEPYSHRALQRHAASAHRLHDAGRHLVPGRGQLRPGMELCRPAQHHGARLAHGVGAGRLPLLLLPDCSL